jgi:hypothetical protein
MVMCVQQYVVLNCDVRVSNKSFENVTEFKHVGTKVTNQNYIHETERLNLLIEELYNLSPSDKVSVCEMGKTCRI